jgi:uncharacterized damage-inducible protein DinB
MAVTPADLRELVDYNYWARDRTIDAVGTLTPEQYSRAMGNSFASIRETLAHVYSAEWVWLSRWQGVSPTAPLSADQWPDLPSLVASWRELEAKIRAVVGGVDDAGIGRVIEYRLLSGQPGQSPFGSMVQHVVNHGTYHRGQITTMLRQMGAAPPKSTDFITFVRERQG